MPPKAAAPGTPEEWLARAKGNLAMARLPKPEDALWEDLCFEAHQAVEKAIKAVYQKRGLLFKFTHDLNELGTGLEKGGMRIPLEIREAYQLTKYAYEGRYPGPLEHATAAEYKKALAIAEAAVKWAEKIVKSSEDSQGQFLHESPAAYAVQPRKAKKAQVVSLRPVPRSLKGAVGRRSNHKTRKVRHKKKGRK